MLCYRYTPCPAMLAAADVGQMAAHCLRGAVATQGRTAPERSRRALMVTFHHPRTRVGLHRLERNHTKRSQRC